MERTHSITDRASLEAEVDALKRLQAPRELDALLPALLDRAFKPTIVN